MRLNPLAWVLACALCVGEAEAATACDAASGSNVLFVGPAGTYPVPSAAAAVAKPGDVVKIQAGSYRGDVATWTADNLTLCGEGGRARLFADGRSAQGKAIWVISGSNVVVQGIEFHGAKVPDENGAGIRAAGGDLTVIDSGFFDNENGILGGDGATVKIERSEFARNGHGDGQSHNIYIGFAKRLHVVASFFHQARVGHNLKSRARENRIEGSYFMDGLHGTASYLADFPNGGVVYLRGNLFHKGPQAENSTAIAYGAEGLKLPVNTLDMVHNTVVMTRSGGAFLSAPAATQSIRLTANLLAGTGNPKLLTGSFPLQELVQKDNFLTSAVQLPAADNLAKPYFWAKAGLLPQLKLRGDNQDADYTRDAPAPFVTRPLATKDRYIGAIQAQP